MPSLQIDANIVYDIMDSHFVAHLLRDGEPDQPAEDGAESSGADAPDNMVDDVIDEVTDALRLFQADYGAVEQAPVAIVYGFVDGVLSNADGGYTVYEDAYIADADNPDYSELDASIDEFVADFEAERMWDEAAKGYIRHAVESARGENVENPGHIIWQVQARGFICGIETAADYEWKVMQTPGGNILITDEDALEEYSARQMAAAMSGGGGIFGKISEMLGIDLGELGKALDENMSEMLDAAIENEYGCSDVSADEAEHPSPEGDEAGKTD